MQDFSFEDETDPEVLKVAPPAADLFSFEEEPDPRVGQVITGQREAEARRKAIETLGTGALGKGAAGKETGFIERTKDALNETTLGSMLTSILSPNPMKTLAEEKVADFGILKDRLYADLRDQGFEGEEANRIAQDAGKEYAWTTEDEDRVRQLSTGELVVNPSRVFGQDLNATKQDIEASNATPEQKAAANRSVEFLRERMAEQLEEDLYSADDSFREVADNWQGDKQSLMDYYTSTQKNRNGFAKSLDAVVNGLRTGGIGIAGTVVGTGAGLAALTGAEGAASSLGDTANLMSQTTQSLQQAQEQRGVTGVYGLAGDLTNTVTQMAPMLIGGAYARGLEGVAQAAVGGASVYGWSAAQGYASKLDDAVALRREELGRELTEQEMVQTLGDSKTQIAAFANGVQTAALSKLLGGGAERAALGAVDDLTIRDFLSRGGREALMDAGFRTEMKAIGRRILGDAADETVEEGLNQLIDSAISSSLLGKDVMLGDLVEETFTAAAMGGLVGGTLPQVRKSRSLVTPAVQETAPLAAQAALDTAPQGGSVTGLDGKEIPVTEPAEVGPNGIPLVEAPAVEAPAVEAPAVEAPAPKVVSREEAASLLAPSEKEGGVDPRTRLRDGDYVLETVPLESIAPNENGDLYDSTVRRPVAEEYAARKEFNPPPILVVPSRDATTLNVLDGGHRVTAARMRGEKTITVLRRADAPAAEAPAVEAPAPAPTLSREELKSTFDLTDDQAEVAESIARAMGLTPEQVLLERQKPVTETPKAAETKETAVPESDIPAPVELPRTIKLGSVSPRFREAAEQMRESLGEPVGMDGDRRIVTPEGVQLEIDNFGKFVTLNSIVTPSDDRGKGLAAKALADLVAEADAQDVPIRLVAKPFGDKGMTKSQLIKWYGKAGFELQQDGETMIRQPKPAQTEAPAPIETTAPAKATRRPSITLDAGRNVGTTVGERLRTPRMAQAEPVTTEVEGVEAAKAQAQEVERLKSEGKITPDDERYWSTPIKGQPKDPLPKVADTNGVQVQEGDVIEFGGVLGGTGRGTVSWVEPRIANASGEIQAGTWVGNGVLNENSTGFTIVERDGKPFNPPRNAPTQPDLLDVPRQRSLSTMRAEIIRKMDELEAEPLKGGGEAQARRGERLQAALGRIERRMMPERTEVSNDTAPDTPDTPEQWAKDEARSKELLAKWGSKSVGKMWKPTTPLEVKTEFEGIVKRLKSPARIEAMREKAKANAPVLPEPEKVDTIAGKLSFVEFEEKGYAPEQVTKEDWVNLQRSERRRLGQPEEGDRKNAPWAEYETYHRDQVEAAVKRGEQVDPDVLKDYPELTKPLRKSFPKDLEKLATSPTREGIENQIAQFYGGERKTLVPIEGRDGYYNVVGGKGVVVETTRGFAFGTEPTQAAAPTETNEDSITVTEQPDGSFLIDGRLGRQLGDRWVVQSDENRQKESRGERQIGGDRIFQSREEAIAETRKDILIDRANEESRNAAQAKEVEQNRIQQEKEAPLNAYLGTRKLSAMQRGKLKTTLSEPSSKRDSSSGKVYSGNRFTVIREMVADGHRPDTAEVPRIQELSRGRSNRMSNEEQRAFERRKAEAGTKTEYRISKGDTYFPVTKAEYELAQWAVENPAAPQQTVLPARSILSERAVKLRIEDNDPVPSDAVDSYGITLPEGYVREGELYVYRSAAPTPTTPPPQSTPAATMLAEGAAKIGKVISVNDVANTAVIEVDGVRGTYQGDLNGENWKRLPDATLKQQLQAPKADAAVVLAQYPAEQHEATIVEMLEGDLSGKKPAMSARVPAPKREIRPQPIQKAVRPVDTTTEMGVIKALEDVADDESRPILNSVYFDADSGLAVATNGKFLVSVPFPSTESKILAIRDGVKITGAASVKKGDAIDGNYPQYQRVIPDYSKDPATQRTWSLTDLLARTRGAARPFDFVDSRAYALSDYLGVTVDPNFMVTVLEALAKSGAKNVTITHLDEMSPIRFDADNGAVGVLMPKRMISGMMSTVIAKDGDERFQTPPTDDRTARFNELTDSLYQGRDSATQEEIDLWKAENPEAWDELSQMREEVLREEGYEQEDYVHETTSKEAFTEFKVGGPNLQSGQELTVGDIWGDKKLSGHAIWFRRKDGRRKIGHQKGAFRSLTVKLRLRMPLMEDRSGIDEYGGFNPDFPHVVQPSDVARLKQLGRDSVVYLDKNGDPDEILIFDPSQVKSADPISAGPKITPDQWGDTGSGDIRYQSDLTAEDEAYLAAVEAGDMETAQRMVDEAAKAAGYEVGPVYHSTNADFTTFIPGMDGLIHVGTTKKQAKTIGGKRTVKAFISVNNPLESGDYGSSTGDWLSRKALAEKKGYDSLVYENLYEGKGASYALFSPSQIKSADPVTRDEQGNVIPLSQRFNPESDDIRYQATTDYNDNEQWDSLSEEGKYDDLLRFVGERLEQMGATRAPRLRAEGMPVEGTPTEGASRAESLFDMDVRRDGQEMAVAQDSQGMGTSDFWLGRGASRVLLRLAERGQSRVSASRRMGRDQRVLSTVTQMQGDGSIVTSIGSDVITEALSAPTQEAAKQYLDAALTEELMHAAHYAAVRETLGGNATASEVGREIEATFQEAKDSMPEDEFRDLVAAVMRSYQGNNTLFTTEEIGEDFDSVTVDQDLVDMMQTMSLTGKLDFVVEMARQHMQMRRESGVTELVRPSWVEKVQAWLGRAIDLVRSYAARPEAVSPKYAEQLARAEDILADLMGDARYQSRPQGAKGSAQRLADGRVLLKGLQNPDFTTAVHEMAHAFEMTGYTGLTDDEVATLKAWAGDKGTDNRGMMVTKASEKFARGWERYLAEGKAPLAELQAVFDKIAKWMLDTYKTLTARQLNVDITPEVRAIFDKIAARMVAPSTIVSVSGVSMTTEDGTPLPPAIDPASDTPIETLDDVVGVVRHALENPLPPPREFNTPEDEPLPYSLQRARADMEADQYGFDTAAWNQAARTFGMLWDQVTSEPAGTGEAALDKLMMSAEPDRPLTDIEVARFTHEGLKRKMVLDRTLQELQTAISNGNADMVAEKQKLVDQASARYQTMLNVIARSRTAAGRALNAWKYALKEDFSQTTLYSRALTHLNGVRIANNKAPLDSLPAAEAQAVAQFAERMAKMQEEIDALKEAQQMGADRAAEQQAMIEALKKERDAARATGSTKVQDATRKILVDKVRKAAKEARERLGLPPAEDTDIRFQAAPDTDPTWRDRVLVLAEVLIANPAMNAAQFADRVRKMFGDVYAAVADRLRRDVDEYLRPMLEDLTGKEIPTPAKVLESIDGSEELTEEMVYDLAKAHVYEGARNTEVLDRVFADLAEFYPDLTREDVAQLFTRYGETRKLSVLEEAKALRAARSLELVQRQIDDLEARGVMQRTGTKKDDPSDALRALRKKRDDLAKSLGYVPRDPETQLSSAQTAAKKRMANEIRDLEAAIASGTPRAYVRRGVEYTPEMQETKAKLDALRKAYAETFGQERTPEERMKAVIRDLDRRIALERDYINRGIIKEADSPVTPIDSPEISARRELLKSLKEQKFAAYDALYPNKRALEQAMKDAEDALKRRQKLVEEGLKPAKDKPKRGEGVVATEELTSLWEAADELDVLLREMRKNRPLTPAQHLAQLERAYESALRTREVLRKRIAENDLTPTPTAPKTPEERTRLIRIENEELRKQLTQMQRDAGVGAFAYEVREAKKVAALEKSIEELRRKRAEKDFSKRKVTEPVTSERIRQLELQKDEEKRKYEEDRAREAFKTLGWTKQKLELGMAAWHARQMFNLSGDFGVLGRQLGKLRTFAMWEDAKTVIRRFRKGEKINFADSTIIGKSLSSAFQVFMKPEVRDGIYSEMATHPRYAFHKRNGFTLTSPHDSSHEINSDGRVRINPMTIFNNKVIAAMMVFKGAVKTAAAVKLALFTGAPVWNIALKGAWETLYGTALGVGGAAFARRVEYAQQTMLNVARWNILEAALLLGGNVDPSENPEYNRQVTEAVMTLTGKISGKGGISKWIKDNAYTLGLFWQFPQYKVSNLQSVVGVPLFRALFNMNQGGKLRPEATKAISLLYGHMVVGNAARIAVWAMLLGVWDDEDEESQFGIVMNPKHPHFLKLKMGRTFIDFIPGMSTWITDLSKTLRDTNLDRAALQAGYVVEKKATSYDKKKLLGEFLSKQLQANWKTIWQVGVEGQFYEGGDLNRMDSLNRLDVIMGEIIMNLTVRDIQKIYETNDPATASVLAGLLLTGQNVAVRETPKEEAKREAEERKRYTVDPRTGESLPPRR